MIEEEKIKAPSVEHIIKDITELQPLLDEENDDDDDIEESAIVGITLMYFFVERQLSHISGGFSAA